ncbi:MAG TPA: PEP-CTERM sorting domain-containing protein [Tepidisphaeraceae bacterium]|nr:PEP-CTERM sorting domain-containing protein [Tepidisphaeraceae bacterium]
MSSYVSSTALANYGVLRAAASGGASGNYSAFPPGYAQDYAHEVLVATYNGDATALYNDAITLISGNKPYGTPVVVRFGFSLHDLIAYTGGIAGSNLAALSYYAGGETGSSQDTATGANFHTFLLDVNAYVGETLTFGAALAAAAAGNTVLPGGIVQVQSSVNALSTSYSSIFVLDPAIGYIAESGTTYLTSLPDEVAAVPEPPALSMLGIAVIGIAGVKRRRRSVAADMADRGRPCPPEEGLVDVGRVDRFPRRSGRGLSGRKLPYRLPVRDSL